MFRYSLVLFDIKNEIRWISNLLIARIRDRNGERIYYLFYSVNEVLVITWIGLILPCTRPFDAGMLLNYMTSDASIFLQLVHVYTYIHTCKYR